MRNLQTIISLFVAIGISVQLSAYNIRQINSRDGLSNSAVTCLLQDKGRTLWIGTYDGLNRYNGANIQIYKPDIKKQNSLSGNVIRKIIESRDGFLWIMTKWGLNKYSKKKDKVEAYYDEFKEDCSIACDSKGNLFILTAQGVLFFYDFSDNSFKEIITSDIKVYRSWPNFTIDDDDKIWIIERGVVKRFTIDWSEASGPKLKRISNFEHSEAVTHIFYDNGKLIIVDRKRDLFIVSSIAKRFIKNIQTEVLENGDITSIILDDKDLVIGFRTSGLIKLDQKKAYEIERMPINCGVFSLLKDDSQDILWIGTDGQGVYACTKDEYAFKGISLEELPVKQQRPIRAVYSDHNNDLWLGTKGNGIIKIKDYDNALEYDWSNVEHLTTENGLSNNAVFSLEMSKQNNILWIGSSGPSLNYYSYDDNKVHILKNDNPIRFVEVHCLMESTNGALWVASLNSLLKVDINKNGSVLEAKSIRKYEFDIKNKQMSNQIYSIYPENDSIMWLAMRGNGAIQLNSISGDYKLITFDKDGVAPMNDILSIYLDKDKNKWFGSSYGINGIRTLPNGNFDYRNFNENEGLPNNTIHGILENTDGNLWLSSNNGIILFDPLKETFRSFNNKTGLKVIEYSDNAYYKDEKLSRYFFGGVDGVVWIKNEEVEKNQFIPSIDFTKLRLFNEEFNIDDFLTSKDGINTLKLKYNQNFFTISFIANDFINGANGRYSYRLQNFSNVWMNSNSYEAQFTNIPPGEYILEVKYDGFDADKSQKSTLNIIILPPWYMNIYAKIMYAIIIIGIALAIYLFLKRKYERKKQKIAYQLDQKYKEEVYESKLRFFTNITHEFCTPLALIQTPSERILNYTGSDSFIKKYAKIIKSNTEKLNILIQEIIDFRRIETGNNVCKIESCNINEICVEIAESFTDLAEENHINFSLDIAPAIIWNSDRKCITKVLNNLISNAFKYTSDNGFIKVLVTIEDEELVLKVYNTGKGITKENIRYIFDRYTVLDNVETNSSRRLSSRNGLGLSICKSMVELLNGTIEVESEVGKYAKFIVKLPVLHLVQAEKTEQKTDSSSNALNFNDSYKTLQVSAEPENRPSILIIDDNKEILWILQDILSDEFNVVTAENGNDGLEKLVNSMPELVITDIMMPNLDGMSLTRKIKANPYTMHIPLIILSAKSAIDDRIEGVEAGADAYIPKPFDIQYLKTIVRQLIEKKKKLQKYYSSSASAFDYVNGQLLSKEDRDLIQSATQIIADNINNIEFTPEDLADNLQISIRSLYRKFKELDILPPKDFIKEQRIAYAAKLLLSTNLTIQEVMYSTGFTTRSHFYKEFVKRYNLSPKEYREEHSI